MTDNDTILTPHNLQALVRESMPFGKYQGYLIADLPEEYLLWFDKKGFPKGQLGELLQLALLLNIDGSRALLDPLRPPAAEPTRPTKACIRFD
jgi:uncharacterized protein